MGLTSYFKSPQEKLMPSYDDEKNFHLFRIPMSKYQLGIYEEARVEERKEELSNIKKRKNPLYDNESNYSDDKSETLKISDLSLDLDIKDLDDTDLFTNELLNEPEINLDIEEL